MNQSHAANAARSSLLAGKVAVVTGGARGIGRAIAFGMAAAGAKVVVNDLGVAVDGSGPDLRPAEEAAECIRQAGGEAAACHESVSTVAGGERIVQSALDNFGRIDTLVCAAGILRPASLFDMTEADWDAVIEVHLKGHFTTMRAAAKVFRGQRSGSILAMTSVGGLEGSTVQPNYSAAKEGIIGLMRSTALTLAPFGATCNAILPIASTRMSERISPGNSNPSADHIAPLAVFLSADDSRHITGQVVEVSGARVALYAQPQKIRTAFREGGWSAQALAGDWDATLGVDRLVRQRH